METPGARHARSGMFVRPQLTRHRGELVDVAVSRVRMCAPSPGVGDLEASTN